VVVPGPVGVPAAAVRRGSVVSGSAVLPCSARASGRVVGVVISALRRRYVSVLARLGACRAASDAMPPHLALHGHARSSVLVAPARLALGALPQAPARMRRLSACSPMPLWRAAPSWLLVAQPPW